MTLSQAYKNSLIAQRPDIQSNFLKFRSIRAFMGIYQISAGKVFLTFSSTNNFGPTLRVGKATLVKICAFDCSLNFDTQMNHCLNE